MQVDIQPEEGSSLSGESKDKDQDTKDKDQDTKVKDQHTKGSSSLVISKVGLGAI
jgi:hypothetical protein